MTAMTWNPFDWTAGPFLAFYVTFAAIIFAWGYFQRSAIGPTAQVTHKLNALELAYLAGGARRLGDAVLLCLTSGRGATIDRREYTITVTDQRPLTQFTGRAPLQSPRPNMTRAQFQDTVKPIIERVQARLQTLGYAPTKKQMMSFYLDVLSPVALLVGFGIIKAYVGAGRHHPIGILIFLIVATVIGGIVLARSPTRTRAGKEALDSYQSSNARASRAPRDHELLLALALSGPIILSGTAYASVYDAAKTMSSSSGGGGDGGSGCGGGGGGGGGCGGCSS